jgi:hypothetical protein
MPNVGAPIGPGTPAWPYVEGLALEVREGILCGAR